MHRLGLFIVDSQVPPAVLDKPVAPDELVFLLRAGLMLAPRVALIGDELPFAYQSCRERECCLRK
jgi:hypothetical protein